MRRSGTVSDRGQRAMSMASTPPQTHQAIAQVEEAGILEKRTGYSRNRVHAATEAHGIVNRPFGEEPPLPGQADLE